MIKNCNFYWQTLLFVLLTANYHANSNAQNSATPKKQAVAKKTRPTSKKERRIARKEKARNKPKKVEHAFRDMTFAELKQMKDTLLQENNKAAAVKFLEKMMTTCDDLAQLRSITLEYADVLYDTGDLTKACTTYQEFTKLYPGSDKVEYAYYKAILCSFKQILDAEHDQSKTKDALDLATAFLERSALFTTYLPEVSKIANQCRQRLLDHDIGITNFYLNRGSLVAAQKRIDGIKTLFTTDLPSSQSQVLVLEIDLATKLNNPVLAETKRKELALNFPDVHASLTAQKPIRLAHRF